MLVGANPDELDALSSRMASSAERLKFLHTQALAEIRRSPWRGPAAVSFEQRWQRDAKAQIYNTAELLLAAADSLRRNSAEQRRASAAAGGSFSSGALLGSAAAMATSVTMATTCATKTKSIERFASGRSALVDSLDQLTGESKIGRKEIQIRRLDNGKYIVIMPGVVDLSDGFEKAKQAALRAGPMGGIAMPLAGIAAAGTEWFAPNGSGSVRDMRHAFFDAVSPDAPNPYAMRVKEAMQGAGVPAGADVMLVGHSYGAYTAANLAADRGFNDALGASRGYHVNVTHVVAAGAATDGYLDRIPAETHALVLNNRYDQAYQAENVVQNQLYGDVDPTHPSHKEIVFNGGTKGFGHDPSNYVSWMRNSTDRRDLTNWLDTAGGYTQPGSASNYEVPDIK